MESHKTKHDLTGLLQDIENGKPQQNRKDLACKLSPKEPSGQQQDISVFGIIAKHVNNQVVKQIANAPHPSRIELCKTMESSDLVCKTKLYNNLCRT